MGYWKREYTERRTGRTLFRPETNGKPKIPPVPDQPAEPGTEDEKDRSGHRPAYSRDS